MPEVGAVAVVAAIVVASLLVAVVQRQRTRKAWRGFARAMGLRFRPGSLFSRPEVRGDLDGRRFRLWSFTRGSGKNRTTYMALELQLRGRMPHGIRIYREGFFSKVGKFLGTQDVQTGDAEFDDAFMIKGDDPDAVCEWLTPDRRWAILPLRHVPGCEVRQNRIYVEQRGLIRSQPRLQELSRRLLEAAVAMESHGA